MRTESLKGRFKLGYRELIVVHLIGLVALATDLAVFDAGLAKALAKLVVVVCMMYSGMGVGVVTWRENVAKCGHWKLLFFVACLGGAWAVSEWYVAFEERWISMVFSLYTFWFVCIAVGFGMTFVAEWLARRWRATR